MSKERRKIIWHCAAGHDFEVEDELRRTTCPICGGSNVERLVKEKDRTARKSLRTWFWR